MGFTGEGGGSASSFGQGGGTSSNKNSGETNEETKKGWKEIAIEMADQGEDETVGAIIKELAADGDWNLDGGAIALGGALAEKFGKQLERFQHEHSLISNSGVLFSEVPGELYNYTENFSYDPVRSSIGSVWAKSSGDSIFYPNKIGSGNGNSQAALKFNKLLGKTENEIKDIVGPNGIPFGYKYIPKVKFEFSGKMKSWGATHFMLGKEFTPDSDDESSIKCRILDIGKCQYLYLYFDLSGYNSVFKPVVPFNMLFNAKQKLEGYVYQSSLDPEKFKYLQFNATKVGFDFSKYNASFITKDSTLTDLASNGVEIIEVGEPLFMNQDAIIQDIEAKLYVDEVFSSQAAISEEAVPFFGSENLQGELIADVKPIYNFFSPMWEYASKGLTEKMVPPIYAAAAWKVNVDVLPPQFDFEKFAKSFIICDNDPEEYKNSISVKASNNVVIGQDKLILDTVEDLKEQFPMYNEITFSATAPNQLGIIFQESGMTVEFLKTLLTYVYNDYSATGTEAMMNKISKVLGLAMVQPQIVYPTDTTIISKLKEPASIDLFEDDQKLTQDQDDLVTYDFLAWLEYYINEINGHLSDNEFKLYNSDTFQQYTSYFGDKKFQSSFQKREGLSFKKLLALLKFLSSAKNIVENNFRAYHDLLGGEKALSDILYYRIEKRYQKTGEVIQNFFVMPPKIDPDKGFQSQIKIIDSQVRYAQAYTYHIFAVKAVVGTEYKMLVAPDETQTQLFQSNLELDTTSQAEQVINPPYTIFQKHLATGQSNLLNLYPLAEFGFDGENSKLGNFVMPIKFSMRPNLKIYEVPLYKEQDVLILDKPPMPPLVNVYPLHGKKNNILMTLETQTGDRELTPIPIEVKDTTYFVTERFSQKRDIVYPGGEYVYPTLRFKSDDDSSSYEIYRCEGIAPKSYSDFRGKLYRTLDKLAPIPEAGFEDTIKVNTKYYYLFRSLDLHGNISNPSPIYEVEMVEASDEVYYPIIKVLDIEEIQNSLAESEVTEMTSKTKTLKKTSYIFPAEQQLLLDEEASNIDGSTANVPSNDPVLGIAADTIWGKKFKFRFVSRHTGKAIDVNVDFNREHVKPQTPPEPCFEPEQE